MPTDVVTTILIEPGLDSAGDYISPGVLVRAFERWKAKGDPLPVSKGFRDTLEDRLGEADLELADDGSVVAHFQPLFPDKLPVEYELAMGGHGRREGKNDRRVVSDLTFTIAAVVRPGDKIRAVPNAD